jgi:hypothetical protein
MTARLQISWFGLVAWPLLLCPAFAEQKQKDDEFPSVGDRRWSIVSERLESIGCIADKEKVLRAKDGNPVVFEHKADPRGNVTVVFNHLILPKGNWILHGAKNALDGGPSEQVPEKKPKRMEAVSAVITGLEINATPRSFDEGAKTYRHIFVDVHRHWGWNIGIAHSFQKRSSLHSFGYYPPSGIKPMTRHFVDGQLPIVNTLYLDAQGKLLAGGLMWFEAAPKAKQE